MRYLIILAILFYCSCTDKNYPISDDKDCMKYYKLIKKDWNQDKEGIFYFKSLKPFSSFYPESFEESIHYNKMECIIGLTEKEVKFLFGNPTESYSTNIGKVNSYCMRTPDCIVSSPNSLKVPRLTIAIDTIKNRVDHIYF